jgi:hypothetical protein
MINQSVDATRAERIQEDDWNNLLSALERYMKRPVTADDEQRVLALVVELEKGKMVGVSE